MSRLVITFILLFVFSSELSAQTAYQLSHKLGNGRDSVLANMFFIDYGNGYGTARIKFKSAAGNDSTLIDLAATTLLPTEQIPGCATIDRLYFKLEKTQLIYGSDTGFVLPQYCCFNKNSASGLYEPSGLSYAFDNCQVTVVPFLSVLYLDRKDMTKELVLNYFTSRENFYNSLFGTKTRDLTVSERNVKMYLLVVANTFDDSIGKACAKDMVRAIRFFSDITDFLGIKFEYDTVAGKNYNLTNVENAIEKLKRAGPNDIVIFYYSGHGFRPRADTRRPPFIDLRPNYDKNPNNLNSKSLADIYDKINKMPARLKLVFSDCCNDTSATYSIKAKAPPKTRGFAFSGSMQNAADLFLNSTRMSVLATGAEPGQKSICNDDFGGFFSYNLWTAIENQISFFNTNANWDKIKDETNTNTKKLSYRVYCPVPGNPRNKCYQTPYIQIDKR
jgi:Caspase domain